MNQAVVAIDLGAESGRAMLVTLKDGRATLEEAHRFANRPVRLPSGWHWDITGLWKQIVHGLGEAVRLASSQGSVVRSVGVDTWGVDFGLIGRSGQLLNLPQCYRDERNAPTLEEVLRRVEAQSLWEQTGVATQPYNTLVQLQAQLAQEPLSLAAANGLLLIPDLLHFWLSGKLHHEMTIASTTQMLEAGSMDWAMPLLEALDIPEAMLGEVSPPGTCIGTVRQDVLREAGVQVEQPIEVVLPGSHDTASAVAAVPVVTEPGSQASSGGGETWAFLSSGTWSLLGMELDEPVLSREAFAAGFTNELAVGDRPVPGVEVMPRVRFLKNIAGLWLVQQVRADLASSGEALDYAELTTLASQAQGFRTLIDCNHAPLASPGQACEKIRAYAQATDQPVPQTPGQFVRACLDSLALEYRLTLHDLERVTGRSVSVLHLVGGGGQNALLNQLTADACEIPVVVGPFEATALGNGLVQAMGLGLIEDLAEMRQMVAHSFTPERIEPAGSGETFAPHAERYVTLKTSHHAP